MAQSKHGVEDIRVHIEDLSKVAQACHEIEVVAAGSMYATLIGYEEILAKLNDAGIWWTYDR